MISINTNRGAMTALQNLSSTNTDLQKTQNAISTGKKVANAKDNGAVWAITNKMGSDVLAYDKVRESTERGTAILDTAIAAGEGIMELLNEMKSKALAATQTGLSASSQAALDADFKQLRDQIANVIKNAAFDGMNLVKATPDSVVALGDANGTVATSITVAGASLELGGTIVTVAATSATDTAANATTALGLVNTSITNLGTQLATWGAGAKRLEVHQKFVSKLQDALNSGIGAMADADLSKESAKLQALQVKQQLGVQALSIANSSAQSALSLFRG